MVSKVLVMAMSMVAMTPVMATDRHQMAVGGLMISKTARCGERHCTSVLIYTICIFLSSTIVLVYFIFVLSVYFYQFLFLYLETGKYNVHSWLQMGVSKIKVT